MAWVTPPTFADGNLLTASQLNTLSGDLNETAVSKATAAGRFFASTGVDSLAERIPSAGYVGTQEATTSTTYINLATIGPDVLTLTTGPKAFVLWSAVQWNSNSESETFASLVIGGATSLAADDNAALRHTTINANNAEQGASYGYLFSVTAGVNDFRVQYRVSGGTGTWAQRRIVVIPF